LDNGLPVKPTGNLVQDIGDKDPCAAKRWLAMTHLGIRDDEAPKDFHGLCCLHVLYPLIQSPLRVAVAEHWASGGPESGSWRAPPGRLGQVRVSTCSILR